MKGLVPVAVLGCALLVGGCSQSSSDAGNSTPPAKDAQAAGTPAGQPDPKPMLPEKLLTAGADYYGVTNSSKLTYEVTDPSGKKNDGTQTGKLSAVSEDKATFELTRVDIVNPGTNTDQIEVRPDGVYAVATGGQKFTNPPMELPADAAPGKSWKINTEVSAGGSVAKMTGDLKITGNEKVKTPAGEFDTIVVQLTGNIKLKGQSQPISGKSWYAKGIGLVKQELVQTVSGTKMQNTTVLKKQG